MKSMKRLVLFLGVLAVLPGCARRARPLATKWLSPQAVVLKLPLVAQEELHACGLASVKILCAYYGQDVPREREAELARLVRERRGLSGRELRGALESMGFEAFVFAGALDRGPRGLYGHIDRGRPVIVMTSPDGRANHYELFVGYDEARANVVLIDPRRGAVLLPRVRFESLWEKAKRFALLAVPRDLEGKEAHGDSS
jgi:ABC-type bacteriocin/lantibiotic exporter with double-glycine peptidase domain